MALASVSATLGSMIVAFAAIPRIIFGIARDGNFFGPHISRVFGFVHPRWRTPVPAIILFGVMSTGFALFSSDVVDWIFSGAYVWILIYIAFNVLCFANRVLHPGEDHLFPKWFTVVPLIGAVLTGVALYYAYIGVHGDYYWRALIVIGVAALATLIAHFVPKIDAPAEAEPRAGLATGLTSGGCPRRSQQVGHEARVRAWGGGSGRSARRARSSASTRRVSAGSITSSTRSTPAAS